MAARQLIPSLCRGAIYGLMALQVGARTPDKAFGVGILVAVLSTGIDVYGVVPFLMMQIHRVDHWNAHVPPFGS